MSTKQFQTTLAILTIFVGIAAVTGTYAQAAGFGGGYGRFGGHMRVGSGITGQVTTINGSTLTVTSTNPKDSTTTTYTVDASGAKIQKNGSVATLAAVVVGDKVMIPGTVNGTSVTATNIFDGVFGREMGRGLKAGAGGSGNPLIQGNGQPVIGGTVASISGTTMAITNKSNVTYTVDLTNAKISKGSNANASVSDIVVGDIVIVQGTINGTSVTAASVTDQSGQANIQSGTGGGNSGENAQQTHPGFFSRIGSFFTHLFGF